MKIRAMKPRDYPLVERIGKSLGHTKDGRGWFTEDAYSKYIPFDTQVHKGFVAVEDSRIIGFITYSSYDNIPMTPFISWIAVDPNNHRQGTGSRLVARVEKELRSIGIKELFVETPTKEAGIGSDYEKTYRFYEGIGFILTRTRTRDSPDNNCDCDMAVLRKVLP